MLIHDAPQLEYVAPLGRFSKPFCDAVKHFRQAAAHAVEDDDPEDEATVGSDRRHHMSGQEPRGVSPLDFCHHHHHAHEDEWHHQVSDEAADVPHRCFEPLFTESLFILRERVEQRLQLVGVGPRPENTSHPAQQLIQAQYDDVHIDRRRDVAPTQTLSDVVDHGQQGQKQEIQQDVSSSCRRAQPPAAVGHREGQRPAQSRPQQSRTQHVQQWPTTAC